MSDMDGLTAFWRARLDERQAVAREAAGLTEHWVAEEPAVGVVLVDGEPLIEGHIAGLTAHIALNDPASVLADVAADREILAMYEAQAGKASVNAMEEDRAWLLERVVEARAARFASHPEYKAGWKP